MRSHTHPNKFQKGMSVFCHKLTNRIRNSFVICKLYTFIYNEIHCVVFKAGPIRFNQLTKKLKIRILSETSILYLIRHASDVLIVGMSNCRKTNMLEEN